MYGKLTNYAVTYFCYSHFCLENILSYYKVCALQISNVLFTCPKWQSYKTFFSVPDQKEQ